MEKGEETEIVIECLVLDVCFLFDVERSMLNVGRSSFKTASDSININCERHKIT